MCGKQIKDIDSISYHIEFYSIVNHVINPRTSENINQIKQIRNAHIKICPSKYPFPLVFYVTCDTTSVLCLPSTYIKNPNKKIYVSDSSASRSPLGKKMKIKNREYHAVLSRRRSS